MAKENTNKDKVIIEGNLRSAYTHEDRNNDGSVKTVTNILTLEPDAKIDGSDKIWDFFDGFFEGTAPKWIPGWYKEKSKITLKSAYPIPVMIVDTNERLDFSEFVKRGLIGGAHVQIKCNVKDSAIYPSAFKVLEDGEEYDAFADF